MIHKKFLMMANSMFIGGAVRLNPLRVTSRVNQDRQVQKAPTFHCQSCAHHSSFPYPMTNSKMRTDRIISKRILNRCWWKIPSLAMYSVYALITRDSSEERMSVMLENIKKLRCPSLIPVQDHNMKSLEMWGHTNTYTLYMHTHFLHLKGTYPRSNLHWQIRIKS